MGAPSCSEPGVHFDGEKQETTEPRGQEESPSFLESEETVEDEKRDKIKQ